MIVGYNPLSITGKWNFRDWSLDFSFSASLDGIEIEAEAGPLEFGLKVTENNISGNVSTGKDSLSVEYGDDGEVDVELGLGPETVTAKSVFGETTYQAELDYGLGSVTVFDSPKSDDGQESPGSEVGDDRSGDPKGDPDAGADHPGGLAADDTDLEAFAALHDGNDDGVFDARDVDWSKAGVWRDADGEADAGEFHTLSSLGITSIGLTSDGVAEDVSGNCITGRSSYTLSDGTTRELADAAGVALLGGAGASNVEAAIGGGGGGLAGCGRSRPAGIGWRSWTPISLASSLSRP